jgi:transcriptional regulator with XRE-family HTH domain
MEFKERLKELRTSRNMTITELSKKSGLSIGMIGSLETGKRNASKKTIKILADVFKVSEEWLETGEDNNSIIKDFINRLVEEKIITDPYSIPEDVQKMILKTVEAEIALLMKKKEK